jgi:hypothetical protein
MKCVKSGRKHSRRPEYGGFRHAGVVADFSDEQVSPTQIMVLPAVPLPGGYGDRGRLALDDACRSGTGTSGGGTCFSTKDHHDEARVPGCFDRRDWHHSPLTAHRSPRARVPGRHSRSVRRRRRQYSAARDQEPDQPNRTARRNRAKSPGPTRADGSRHAWQQPIHAVLDGTVIAVDDSVPDNFGNKRSPANTSGRSSHIVVEHPGKRHSMTE